jgi:hypothetical protein
MRRGGRHRRALALMLLIMTSAMSACLLVLACGFQVLGGSAEETTNDGQSPFDDGALRDSTSDAQGGGGEEDGDGSSVEEIDGAPGCPSRFVRRGSSCVDEAKKHFTITANPSGNWTWAYRLNDAAAPIVTYPVSFVHDAQAGIHVWSRVTTALEPAVFLNAQDATVNLYGSFTMQPFELAFHPGPTNERSVVRWTAPIAANFSATIVARGLSGYNGAPPTTTGITVVRNNNNAAPLAAALLPTPDAGVQRIELSSSPWTQGETLDVRLDFGANGNYGFDSTGIDVTIVTPPKAQ